MKVSLVVASGVHQGKVIPIVGTQFLIGRDQQCHLRPASQAISKQHCAVIVRDGAVYLKDFGSTNGTVLNDAVVQNEERPIRNNDNLKIGPLDFTIRIEETPAKSDGTPLPELDPEAAAAVAAVRAAAAKGPQKSTSRDETPSPSSGPKAGTKEAPALKTGSKEMPALKSGPKGGPEATTGSKESPRLAEQSPAVTSGGEPSEAEHDRLAAMLLGLEDGDVPGGSTVVDMPISGLLAAAKEAEAKPDEKAAAAKKAVPTREDTSNAASEILKKMMRRPR